MSEHLKQRIEKLEAAICAIQESTEELRRSALIELAYADIKKTEPPEWASDMKTFLDKPDQGVTF